MLLSDPQTLGAGEINRTLMSLFPSQNVYNQIYL